MLNSYIEYSDEKKRYLDELRDYALGGTYTNTRHKEYLLKNYMEPISKQATDLNLSQAAIYKNRNIINKDLVGRVGTEIVKDILNGNFNEVDTVLNNAMSNKSVSSIIMQNVVDSIKDREGEKGSSYELSQCIDEMSLLKKYSVLDLELDLDKLDINKLSYLIRLLSFEETNVKDRNRLLEAIKR